VKNLNKCSTKVYIIFIPANINIILFYEIAALLLIYSDIRFDVSKELFFCSNYSKKYHKFF